MYWAGCTKQWGWGRRDGEGEQGAPGLAATLSPTGQLLLSLQGPLRVPFLQEAL